MLTATFIHAQGVGPATERSLWAQGAVTWHAYRDMASDLKIGARHRERLEETVAESIAHLDDRRVQYFAHAIPRREHWRAVSSFPRLGYLDIETDGGLGDNSITVIGLSDGFECKQYLKGRNLTDFADDCREFDGFVTFFGLGFDVPFLIRRFPELHSVFADRLHIDLCPLLKRLGYSGGLKSVERQLKIYRVPETDGLDGMDAVRLWDSYRRGGRGAEEALGLLLAYNKEDVINMKALLEYGLPHMRQNTGID